MTPHYKIKNKNSRSTAGVGVLQTDKSKFILYHRSKMPLTNAERKKKYIEKLKATDKFDDFKKKNAVGAKKRRDRINAGLNELPKNVRDRTKRLNREYSKRKVAEYRQRKKQAQGLIVETSVGNREPVKVQSSDGMYKTSSALAKAVAKVKRSLPSTTPKKKQVVKKILKIFEPADRQEVVDDNVHQPTRTKGLSSTVVAEVEQFYARDDISRISPNVKDCRKFLNPADGTKEYRQIRYLIYKLADVYTMFVKHIEDGAVDQKIPVKFSKFCSLRPTHIKLVSNTPLDQCFCLYHSNFISCCDAIHRTMTEFPKYDSQLERILLCEEPKKDCWLRKCSKCPNAKRQVTDILNRSGSSKSSSVSLTRWVKDDIANRFKKIVEPMTLEKLIDHFIKLLPEFLQHVYIKRSQAASFEKDNDEVKNSNGTIALLQADFAENFVCEAQDEIQSAHWNQATV